MAKLFPPKPPPPGPTISTSLRLPQSLVEELDQVASATGYTRTQVMIRLMRRGLQLYWSEESKASSKPKK